MLERVQRCMALRVCSAYRTASYEAILVIAGIPPIKLLAEERAAVYNGQKATRALNILFEEWQRRWEGAKQGRWTYNILKSVKRWAERTHGEVNYYLTQVLSGHGCFGEYLCHIGKRDSSECHYCGETDDAGHTTFRCPRWSEERRAMQHSIGTQLGENNMISLMLEGREKWNIIETYINNIIKVKEEEESEHGRPNH